MTLLSVPVSQPLPLDAVGSPFVAFGLYKLRGDYAGNCIRVRESGGNTQADIGFDSSGLLNEAALLSHCGSNDGFVVTWYDQSGNSRDLTNATTSTQPQIVDDGAVIKRFGKPAVLCRDDSLDAALGASLANDDLTVVTVSQSQSEIDTGAAVFGLINGGSVVMSLDMINQSFRVWSWDAPGGNFTNSGDSSDKAYCNVRPQVAVIRLHTNGDCDFIYNDVHVETKSLSEHGATGSSLRIGSSAASGINADMWSLIVYDRVLSDTEASSVYASINEYHSLGPIRPLPTYSVRDRWNADSVLRKWISGIPESQLLVTRGSLTWDGTYADTDDLYRMYLVFAGGQVNFGEDLTGMLADPIWFRINPGQSGSGGMDTASQIRIWKRPINGTSSPCWATLYAHSLPKAAGAEGNPYFGQRAVALRAVIQAAYSLLTWMQALDQFPDNDNTYAIGGNLMASAYVYRNCKDVMPPHVQNAFMDLLFRCCQKLWWLDANRLFGNMDMKSIAALAQCSAAFPDAARKAVCAEAARNILFGSRTGTADTTNRAVGDYSNAGYIMEAGSPETTYNGHSINWIAEAYRVTHGDALWSFLGDVVQRMTKFKIYQYFPDPDGYVDGPSGYSGRTGGSYVFDQGQEYWRDANLAASFTEGRPLAASLGSEATLDAAIDGAILQWNNTSNIDDDCILVSGTGAAHTGGSASTTVTLTNSPDLSGLLVANNSGGDWRAYLWLDVNGGTWSQLSAFNDTTNTVTGDISFNIASGSPVDYRIEKGPKVWGGNSSWWPPENYYPVPAGYYDAQRALIAGNDATLKTPWQSTSTHNVSFGDEFWSYKDTDGTREWGFFVEAVASPGAYQGWYGGNLETFWTRDTGMVICSKHDKSGNQAAQLENTRVFQVIDDWASSHVWIKDDSDMRFSSVATNLPPSAVVWDINGTPKTVTVEMTVDQSATWYGETNAEGGDGLSGSCTVQTDPTNTFTSAGHGLQNGDVIGFAASSFPNPITAPAKYFVVNRTTDTWQVSATRGGSAITLTTAGSGVSYAQGTTLKGVHVITSSFEVLSDGIKREATVTHTGTDMAKEMWSVIPVYLRDGSQSSTTETTIEYWTGQSWQAVPTTLINAHYLRLGRDFGSGKKYVWIEFWQPTQPCCLNDAVWIQSYQGDGRFRMIKVDMLGYTGSAKAIPPSSTIWYKVTTTDPGFVPTSPSLSIVYPTTSTVWPEGGAFGVKATCDWVASAGTVYVDYRINAEDWTLLDTMTNTTGNVYEYVGSSVPADMVEIRVRAVPPTGDTASAVVITYSSPYQLVVEDNFTASNGTSIDASYTAWTTNTTGHSYINMGGTIAVQSNAAVASATDSAGALRFIDCDEENNIMMECVAIAGSTSSESGNFAGTGLFARARLSTANEGVIAVVRKTGTPFNLKAGRDGDTQFLKTASYASYSTTNPYRIRFQINHPFTAARFVDINNSNAVAAIIGAFTLPTSLGSERQGYGFNEWLGGSSIDELKIWKRNPSWTPPEILPYEDPDPPPEVTPDLTVNYPTAGLVFPVGGVWPFRAFVDWGDLTPSTVVAYYTTDGTNYTNIGSMQLEAGTTYRYVGGTIPSGVTGVRVVATGMTGGPATVDVAVTSATANTVLSDAFTGANNTVLGAAWSGWQTNTTGNVYSTLNGTVQINTNRAIGTVNTASGNANRIDVNSARMIVEGEVQTGTTALTNGVGVAAQMNGVSGMILAWMTNTTTTTDCFKLSDIGGTQPTATASYASWSVTKFFRIRVQTVGNCAVAQWFDIASGNALAGTCALFNLTTWNSIEFAGFVLGRSQQGSKIDNFIVKTW